MYKYILIIICYHYIDNMILEYRNFHEKPSVYEYYWTPT